MLSSCVNLTALTPRPTT